MKANDPLNAMASAMYSAIAKDLPDITWTRRDGTPRTRRPHSDDVSVHQFPQNWSSTALGFGGVGGAAMTTADTTIIECGAHCAVYFAGRLAYVVENPNRRFWEDAGARSMADVGRKGQYQRRKQDSS